MKSLNLRLVVVAFCAVVCSGSPLWAFQQNTEGSDKESQAEDRAAEQGVEPDDQDAEQSEDTLEYVRIRRNDRRLAVALETSVIRFADSKQFPGKVVDLVGAIHLGEPGYYDELNRRFRDYDVLLYEAVMPKEALKRGLTPGGGAGSRRRNLSDEQEWTEAKVGLQAISVLQLGMKDALGLEFQLAGVNYAANNFVHADMTQEEFEAAMKRRGESFSQMFLREMGKATVAQQNENPLAANLDLVLSLLTSDRVYRVRRIAAVQLAKASEGDAFAGADGSSTIITERNIKALQVLREQLQGKPKSIGVFYGAGHFADMEARLVEEFGFSRKSEEWLVAWKLREEAE
jgi:hypothetical protein